MKKSVFILILLVSVFQIGYSQTATSTIEITETDILLHPEKNTTEMSVFGIALGMTEEQARSVMDDNKETLHYYVDERHGTKDFRIYVYDRDKLGNKNKCVLYLIWEDGKKQLSKITVFESMVDYVKGGTIYLFSPEAVNPKSSGYKKYLGKADKSEVTLDIPSIQLKHTTYYYNSKGLELTVKESSSGTTAVFAFVLVPDYKR